MITASDIQARMTSDDYLKVFDRAGVGAADSGFVATCIADAESRVNMRLIAAFGTTLDAAGGTVDSAVKAACVAYAVSYAINLNPLITDAETAPYRRAVRDADEFFDRLAKDNATRAVTSPVGRARPHASLSNAIDDAGNPTNPLVRAADRRDGSAY